VKFVALELSNVGKLCVKFVALGLSNIDRVIKRVTARKATYVLNIKISGPYRRCATAQNVDAAKISDRAKATAKAEDSVKSKDDLLTKAIAKKREHRGSAS